MVSKDETTLLVINDLPDQLELISTLLRNAGYRVLTAGDGHEGFDIARQKHPDLVISDVMMPRINGIELCRLIRAADGELAATPILLVSAVRVDSESAVEGLEAGADDYLEVPYHPMSLIAKITRLMERKRSVDALRESENKYRLLMEQASDGIFILDGRGNLIEANSQAYQMLGYTDHEPLGFNVKDFLPTEDQGVDPLMFDGLGCAKTVIEERSLRRRDQTEMVKFYRTQPSRCLTLPF